MFIIICQAPLRGVLAVRASPSVANGGATASPPQTPPQSPAGLTLSTRASPGPPAKLASPKSEVAAGTRAAPAEQQVRRSTFFCFYALRSGREAVAGTQGGRSGREAEV